LDSATAGIAKESLAAAMLAFSNPDQSSSAGGGLFSAGQTRTSSDQRWFILQDNFLAYYTDPHSPTIRYYWPLDYCTVSLITLTNNTLALMIKPHDQYPFHKLKPKTSLLFGQTDHMTRDWYACIMEKTRRFKHSRVFGTSLAELARRPGATSVIPEFVQQAFNRAYYTSLNNKNLFLPPSNRQSGADNARSLIDNGKAAEAVANTDEVLMTQTALSFFGELIDPIFTNETQRACLDYVSRFPSSATADKDALCEVIATMSPEKAVALKYLINFLTMWTSRVSLPSQFPVLLAPLLVRCESQVAVPALIGVVTKVLTDMQMFINDIGIPSDKQALEYVLSHPPSEEEEQIVIPVTMIAPTTTQKMIKSLASSKGVDNLVPVADSHGSSKESHHNASDATSMITGFFRRRKHASEQPKEQVKPGKSESESDELSDIEIDDVEDYYESSELDQPAPAAEPEAQETPRMNKVMRGWTRLRSSFRLSMHSSPHSSSQQSSAQPSPLRSSASHPVLPSASPSKFEQSAIKQSVVIDSEEQEEQEESDQSDKSEKSEKSEQDSP